MSKYLIKCGKKAVNEMTGMTGNGKLRQWLIEQVDGGKYPGLVWEDRDKSVFRIPWKHAGKQDYNREEDAALFKAWALFKGKYREGIDKPDPPTWKTRLRCALNKSNDFEELVDKSQLDTSEPYKVYRVIPEDTKRASKSFENNSTLTNSSTYSLFPTYTSLPSQVSSFLSSPEKEWQEEASLSDLYYPYSQNTYPTHWEPGYQISSSFYGCNSIDSSLTPFNLEQCMRSVETLVLSDPRLKVSVFSGDSLIRDVIVFSLEGCRLAPYEENQTYGGPELVPLPQSEGTKLEQGVLVWMNPDGLCARRLCNARVYWEGAATAYTDKPNKLERNQTSKLLDIQLFITELQSCYLQARPPPRFQVLLYFENNNPLADMKPITVQVEPLFARQLLLMNQQCSPHQIRSHSHGPLLWEQVPSCQPNYYTSSSHQHHNHLQD